MSVIRDLLVLAILTKFLIEIANTLPIEWFAIGCLGLPFLLGLSGRKEGFLRHGVAVAGLVIFFVRLCERRVEAAFWSVLGIAVIVYLLGRWVGRFIP